jgi:hypothetical protein
MIGMAGYDPCLALAEYTGWVGEWLRAEVDRLPRDVGVTYMCTQGRIAIRLEQELERGHHDELVLGCPASAVTCAWLRWRHRDLRVVLAPSARQRKRRRTRLGRTGARASARPPAADAMPR